MARTLIGQLILRLQQNATTEGKKVEQALVGIEAAARRLGAAPWGRSFQQQLDRLKLSPREFDTVLSSWNRLQQRISTANLSPGGRRDAIADWRAATLQHFAAVRADMDVTERRARTFGRNIQTFLKPALVAMGAYTGFYAAGIALRGGLTAASTRERMGWRLDMAGIDQNDQLRIAAAAQALSHQYRSIDQTEIMQMGLQSLGAMGDIDRVLEVLPDLARARVALQSAKGIEAAPGELAQLMRGIDVLGQNADGEVGIEQVRQIIDGAVRAVQIESNDLDIGKYWQFARRAKIASSALSTEFLATVAPALMQDMGPETAGNAISSAYQAFVIGSTATASLKNLAEQQRLGLRVGDGGMHGYGDLIGDSLFGSNPYQWVKEYLVPALAADGVNMEDEIEIQKAIARLSRNTNATALLARMLIQQPQIDKNVGLYATTMGLDAAEVASERDPFLAWEGFQSSFRNLAGALSTQMEIISPALNTLTDLINRLAGATENSPGWAVALGVGGVAAGGLAAWKIGAGVWGLITAGTQLQIAASMLQGAAVAQGGGIGRMGAAGGAGMAASKFGFRSLLTKVGIPALAALGIWGALTPVREGVEHAGRSVTTWPEPTGENIDLLRERLADYDARIADAGPVIPGGLDPVWALRHEREVLANQIEVMSQELSDTLAIEATPIVNVDQIDAAIAKAERLVGLLRQVGVISASGQRAANQAISNLYSDYGVVP